ncbi:MAG TPA: choice-of-anchor D domain-containing protein [Candidatus Kapabacteria bacterium]|nr:choice-of-anchor D domain-containing protein [Candidatus Kapabacteria bacterium]
MVLLVAYPSFSAAQGRVNDYLVEQFDGGMTWDWSAPYTYLGWSDNTYYSVSMPFSFQFDGNTVAAGSTVRVSTNGWLQFTLPGYNPTASTTTYNVLGSSTYRNMIQFFGVNLYPSGGVYHQTTGSSPNRVWSIYYPSVRYQASSSYPYVSMMVKLYEENGQIEFLYSPNNQYLGSSVVNAGVGVNGHVVPSFQSLTLENTIDNTPLRNWRIRPPKPSRPLLSVSVKSIDFGEREVGSEPVTACLTVTNVGTPGEPGADNSPLTFTGTRFNSTNDFTLIADPQEPLYPGESKEYCVSFTPLNMGDLSAGLDIRTNGKDSGNRLIPFKAFGLAGKMEVPVENLFRKTRTRVGSDLVQSVPVQNEGNLPMNIIDVTVGGEFADQYSVVEIPQDPIEPGETDNILIEYNAIFEGLNDAHITITSDAAFEPEHTVQLFGWGIVPRLAVTTSMTGSDSVRIGDTAYYTVRLENVGTDTLLIKQDYFASADRDFFYAGLIGADSIIPPTQVRELVVGFAPQARGVRQARLRLTTNIPKTFDEFARDTSEFNVDFTHVGVPSGLLYAETNLLDTSLVGSAVCNPFTIFNNGLEALAVTSLNVSGLNAGDFTINGITLPVTIAAMSSITGEICVTPSQRGERNAEITVNASSNGQNYTQVLPVTVLGQLACASPDMTSAFAGEIVRVSASKNATITVTNCGDVPTIYNATVAGEGYALVSAPMSDAIAPGATHTYEVSFAPLAMSMLPGTLTISGDNVAEIVVNLEGTGGMAVLAASNTNAGSLAVGSSIDLDVTVENSGNLDWTGIAPAVDGGDFVVKNAPTTIAANSSGTLTFTFTPSIEGVRTATVTFPGSDVASFSFALNGEGVTANVRSTEANGYALGQNFPNPAVSSSTIRFSMAKAGYAKLIVSDVTGKVVATLAEGSYPQGETSISFSTSELPAGNYYYELIAGGEKLQRAMLVGQ